MRLILLVLTTFAAFPGSSPHAQSVVEQKWLRSLPRVRKIPWDELNLNEKDDSYSNLTASWNGVTVDIKWVGAISGNCESALSEEGGIAQLLSWHDVGRELLGYTYAPTRVEGVYSYSMVRKLPPGARYQTQYTYERDDKTLKRVIPQRRMPEGIDITPAMIDDVNRAFDVFDALRLRADAATFILTPDGRAVLENNECFNFVSTSAEAHRLNAPWRAALVAGLRGVLNAKRHASRSLPRRK